MTIFDRAMVREKTIWKPFTRQMVFNADDILERAIIFGLYSNIYVNGHTYLEAIEAERLLQIIAVYDQSIAQLENEEAMLVIDFAAKRYLEEVDQIIHEKKVETIHDEIAAENSKWDARLAALEADYEALETLTIEAQSQVDKAEARITTLQAQIETESANYAMVAADISREQLRTLPWI